MRSVGDGSEIISDIHSKSSGKGKNKIDRYIPGKGLVKCLVSKFGFRRNSNHRIVSSERGTVFGRKISILSVELHYFFDGILKNYSNKRSVLETTTDRFIKHQNKHEFDITLLFRFNQK